ncbi:hypothetical protein [Nocardioides euryhalodurans]|uniref:Uncharacterized protein n=1 Tax=Nocardioides euryhalodurans TaxID=2518370 RepID=A0A4P7GIQ2_9ACTN|nr:hypothetical protein [Nocardioides euryhalodurans]QBR91825.1 hypothetical protein EXE57_05710 [Nocardioides euryhalodurans]
MPTENQVRGEWGEKQVAKLVDCQVCRARKLSQLAGSFPSLDLVCRNCGGYLAQVKTPKMDAAKAPDWRPRTLMGAGWNPLQVQMSIGSMRDLYVVGAIPHRSTYRLAWIDRVPGPALLANADVFEYRLAVIGGGTRRHAMFNIAYHRIPPACVINVFTA